MSVAVQRSPLTGVGIIEKLCVRSLRDNFCAANARLNVEKLCQINKLSRALPDETIKERDRMIDICIGFLSAIANV
jgi:hypothetical protein